MQDGPVHCLAIQQHSLLTVTRMLDKDNSHFGTTTDTVTDLITSSARVGWLVGWSLTSLFQARG